MQQQGGFMIKCISTEAAKQVAECAKSFLSAQKLKSNDWIDALDTYGKTVSVDYECFMDWDDFDGLFQRMCEHIEKTLPNLMESGEAKYANLSVGSDFTLIMDRDDEGIHITNRIRDDEMIAEMAESGLPVEEIAEILGLSEEAVQSALNLDDEEE